MRKTWTLLAAGMAASLMMLSGCAGAAGAETPAASETVSEAETETGEPEGAETENSDTEDTDGKNGETADGEASEISEEGEQAGSFVPLKIWGTIEEVTESGMTVDNQSPESASGEMVFNLDPENTLVLDAVNGFPVPYEDVEKGSFEAYLGPAMSMSLPPQTTPYMVIVNIPEDFSAPQYVIASGALEETEDGRILRGIGGEEYKISEDAEIIPYLTRNIVTMEDIAEGSGCLVWLDEEDAVEKIVLFAR